MHKNELDTQSKRHQETETAGYKERSDVARGLERRDGLTSRTDTTRIEFERGHE